MTVRWRCLPFVLLGLLPQSFVAAAHSFENVAIVRTVELGGSLVHVTTTYAIKALENGSQKYTITLGEDEWDKSSWLEAKIKGQNTPLNVEALQLGPTECVECQFIAFIFSSLTVLSGVQWCVLLHG